MALQNTRDPEKAKVALERWMSGAVGQAVTVTAVETPQDSGLSAETLMFSATWDGGGGDYVARVAPQGPGVFPSYDLVAEQRVMQALSQHTDVPVPATPWVETDASVLGAPFLVMERLTGRVASDDPPFTTGGWVLDLSPEERARMCDNALVTLAQIHQADYQALGLEPRLARPEDGDTAYDQQLTHWRETYEWARDGESNATVEAGFEWLADNRPDTDERTVLSWGDARIGNMLVAGDGSINGVLDWEMVGLGAPDLDVGWWLFMLRHHTEGVGVQLPEGFPTRAETAERYTQLTGHTLEHLDFYEAFAAVRLSILMHRAGRMMVDAGLLPPDSTMRFNNPASQLLAKLIGAEAPTGAAESFIGNRG